MKTNFWSSTAVRSVSAVVLGITLLTLPAPAQTKSIRHSPPLKEAAPAKAGVSPERLARIDAMCEDAIRENRIPGVVALVARNGKIVYHKAFGLADNAANQPDRSPTGLRLKPSASMFRRCRPIPGQQKAKTEKHALFSVSLVVRLAGIVARWNMIRGILQLGACRT